MQRAFAWDYGGRMTERPTIRVQDPEALAALAHPLRGRLLSLLRADGPATASGLAERVGESSGVTSYHLRKLAEVGFVEEETDRGTKRERWWRAAHTATSWSPSDFLGDPEAHKASVSVRREWYRWQQRLLDQWMAEERDWEPEWVDVAASSDDMVVLTPAEAEALGTELWDTVQRFRERSVAAGRQAGVDGAERVVVLFHTVPIRGEWPL
ncbi:helix-turn-helix domain-containing protein [Nocardioides marmoribigeumensis]